MTSDDGPSLDTHHYAMRSPNDIHIIGGDIGHNKKVLLTVNDLIYQATE